MLVEHGIDDVDEGFVAGEQAMAAGQDITFKPAFEGVLAKHFHDASGGVEFAAVGVFRFVFGEPGLFRSRIDGGEAVRGSFVEAEDAGGNHDAVTYPRKK